MISTGDKAPSAFASLVDQVVFSPLLLGSAMTFAFYSLIPHSPVYHDLLVRYCCGHPIEYATVAMFFIGMAILLKKGSGLSSERASLRQDSLPPTNLSGPHFSNQVADKLHEHVDSQTPQWRLSTWGHRVRDIIHYLRGKQNSEGLEDHLRYLADLASDRVHSSYALVRTITWGIPILGFLGTVIGITDAIANVTPEQLSESLDQVTAGLGVAFDTTALSLSLSMVMVFSTFVVEGAEQQILSQTEELSMRHIATLFSSTQPDSPLLQAEVDAAALLREQTSRWLTSHGEVWSRAVDDLRSNWSAALEDQRERLEQSLNTGVEHTLEGHVQQISDVRTEFLASLQQMVQSFSACLNEDRRSQETQLSQTHELLKTLVEQWQSQTLTAHENSSRQIHQALKSCTDEIQACQQELAHSTGTLAEILSTMNDRGDTLDDVKQDQQHLLQIQGQLTRNLDAVRAAESLEKTLHGLTAAVHLLTMKSPSAKAA
ncbi:MAG: MotA/TolQ/ExbB proton channel family protein [Planctomycetaceae bacterium]